MVVRYELPEHGWIQYDLGAILAELTQAKAALLALVEIPYQRSWADELQRLELKREVAGTSRIEGAEFTEQELEAAMRETPAQLETRSQKQAAAAVSTYRWIATLPIDRPVDQALLTHVHRLLVTGCDDDHCPAGEFRRSDENVTFGAPRHRGVDGGEACAEAVRSLMDAVLTVFRDHDPLVRAFAMHYHIAALHPFVDGNGRTARATEALMLRQTGLRDTLFIAMSNYYYEHKTAYLNALNDVRAGGHDLTPFLKFALRGLDSQCRRLFAEIRTHIAKALYRNTMADLFGRLRSPRKRVMSERHVQVLNLLLDQGAFTVSAALTLSALVDRTRHHYVLKNPDKALARDLSYLSALGAIGARQRPNNQEILVWANLDWPTKITETDFFRLVKAMPKGKVYGFLSS
jgi:Fic family protein